MTPIEILMNEHRVIEQVLSVLESMTNRHAPMNMFDAQDARKAIEFFKGFADRCHHEKEEAQLFPMLEARGLDRENGPTGVMCAEHEDNRAMVRGMSKALDEYEQGNESALKQFHYYADAYCEALRIHIKKEDHCLFPMAMHLLSSDDQNELEQAFDKVESDDMGIGTHEALHKIADSLAEKYNVERVEHEEHICGHHCVQENV